MITFTSREDLILRRIEEMTREVADGYDDDEVIKIVLIALADEVRPMAVDAAAEQDLLVLQ